MMKISAQMLSTNIVKLYSSYAGVDSGAKMFVGQGDSEGG